MKNIYFIIGVFLFISCNNDVNEITIVEDTIRISPTFVTTLNPVDDNGNISNNVIQGITSFENGWFVTQKSGNTILLLNYLDQNGVSLFNTRLPLTSHGQDLSLEKISDNELYLYTSQGDYNNDRDTGMLRLYVQLAASVNDIRDWSQTVVSFDHQYDFNYGNSTPTISEDKSKFAIRSYNTIFVHEAENVLNQQFTDSNHFQLNNAQLIDNKGYSMWYQGIAMQNDYVYCLTGNGNLYSNKKIYKYNSQGIVVGKLAFDKTAVSQEIAIKFEPEGLAIKNEELYFTIMTKSETIAGNIKYLYKTNIP